MRKQWSRVGRTLCWAVLGWLIVPQSVWGAPLFGERRAYPVGTSPVAIATAQLDGVSGLDLASADEGNTISLLSNRGDGVFAPAGYLGISDRYTATDLTSGRFNGDAIDDLAVSADDAGSPNFAGAVLLYQSSAALQFSMNPVTVGQFPTCVVRTDLTGDGIDDVAACGTGLGGNGLVSILRGRADFSFTPPVSVPLGAAAVTRLAVGDLDDDGHPDLVVADTDGNAIWIAYGGPEPTFETPVRLATSVAPSSVVIATLGHDALPAIAVTSRTDGTVEAYRQLQMRLFAARVGYPVGQSPMALAAADVNGDGVVDLLAANHDSNNVTVLLGGTAGNFTFGETISVGRGPVAITVADFNTDGKPDFATADQDDVSFGADTQSVSVVLNGTTPFFTPTPRPTATDTSRPTQTATFTPTPRGTRPATPTPTRTMSASPRPTPTPAGPWDANCDGRFDELDLDTIIDRLFDGETGCFTRPVTAADISALLEALSSAR